MARFFGHDRNELHSGSTSADDCYALAAKVHLFLGPTRGVIGLPFEAIDSFKRGHIASGQNANCCNEKLCPGTLATFERHLPTMRLLIVDGRLDPRVELNVFAQIK